MIKAPKLGSFENMDYELTAIKPTLPNKPRAWFDVLDNDGNYIMWDWNHITQLQIGAARYRIQDFL